MVEHLKPIVELSKEEIRVCADLGVNRWLTKYGSVDRTNYTDKTKLEPEVAANIRSIVAEYAVSKFYGLPQVLPFYPNNEHGYRKDIPDVLPNIEVRTVRTANAIPLFEKDNRPGLFIVGTKVLDTDYYSRVEIWGAIKVESAYRQEWFSKLEGFWRIPKDAFILRKQIPDMGSGVSGHQKQ